MSLLCSEPLLLLLLQLSLDDGQFLFLGRSELFATGCHAALQARFLFSDCFHLWLVYLIAYCFYKGVCPLKFVHDYHRNCPHVVFIKSEDRELSQHFIPKVVSSLAQSRLISLIFQESSQDSPGLY